MIVSMRPPHSIDPEPRPEDRAFDRTSGVMTSIRHVPQGLGRTLDVLLRAKDLMSDVQGVVRASATIRTAVEIIRSLDIRTVCVVDDDGTLVGALSDRELRTLRIPYFIGNEYIGDLKKALDEPVSRLLDSTVVFVDAEASAGEALALMIHHRTPSLPVIDAGGILVGVINYLDMLRKLPLDLDIVRDAAE